MPVTRANSRNEINGFARTLLVVRRERKESRRNEMERGGGGGDERKGGEGERIAPRAS